MKILKNIADSFLVAVVLSAAMFVICYVLGMFIMLQPLDEFGLFLIRIVSAITFLMVFFVRIANE